MLHVVETEISLIRYYWDIADFYQILNILCLPIINLMSYLIFCVTIDIVSLEIFFFAFFRYFLKKS